MDDSVCAQVIYWVRGLAQDKTTPWPIVWLAYLLTPYVAIVALARKVGSWRRS